ncbi:DUF4259 domain-containing protein [Streptomyces sp. NPDC048641]|uniref:DUF4259 domain-containing protein n=1 Tax=unclassified Streptomyces TaxID=2593676 RepID=UPI00342863DA
MSPTAGTDSALNSFVAVPVSADGLRLLAVEALGRVVAGASELAELWDETADDPKWRQSISCIRAVLAPGPAPQEYPLFDLSPDDSAYRSRKLRQKNLQQ